MYAPNHWKWKTSGMASNFYCEFTAQFVLHTTLSPSLSPSKNRIILQQRNETTFPMTDFTLRGHIFTLRKPAKRRCVTIYEYFPQRMRRWSKKGCARASWIATSKTKDKFRHWPPLLWGNPDLSCVGVGTLNSENVSHFFAGLVNGVKDVNRMRKSEGKQKLCRECKTRNGAGREFDG